MIQVQGHRGAAAYAPENTLPSFELAVKMHPDAVECDIHLTTDDVWLVCHDDEIARTSDGHGCITQMTYDQVRACDFGVKFDKKFAGTKIPTLEELLETVNPLSFINIEMKAPFRTGKALEAQLDSFYDILKKHGYCGKTLVSSFHHDVLLQLKQRHPDLPIGLLYAENYSCQETLDMVAKYHADAIHPALCCVLPETVKACIAQGTDVNVWTVDEAKDIQTAISYGVTGIISNKPDAVLAALHR